MQPKDFITKQIGLQRWIADSVLQDLTEEQLNWTPPGTANTIATILLHVTGTDDTFVNMRALGRATNWESGTWSERIGIAGTPGRAGYWDEANAATFALAPILEYVTAVRASVDEYVATLTDEELSRTVQGIGGEQPMAAVIALIIVHAAGHYGEIAALKGAQGAKGLPF